MTFISKKTPKLGQHLLTSRAIAREVAEAAHIEHTDLVLEIGPGKGMLTTELLSLGARVVAIEKDPEMVRILREVFTKEITTEQLIIIEDDIRNFLSTNHYPLTTNYKVAANIPYYITGEIMRLLLTAPHQPSDIALLVQKEVAERIARSKKESILSLSVKAYGEPHYVRTVKAGSFNPPPSVDSAILAIHHISRKNFINIKEEDFFLILHSGFGQKRKTLIGNLLRGKWVKAGNTEERKKLEECFANAGIPFKARAEDVSLEQWLLLTHSLSLL